MMPGCTIIPRRRKKMAKRKSNFEKTTDPNFVLDRNTGTLLNTNSDGYAMIKKAREDAKRVRTMEERIATLEDKVRELEQIIYRLE